VVGRVSQGVGAWGSDAGAGDQNVKTI
jgi:hypothetical protein